MALSVAGVEPVPEDVLIVNVAELAPAAIVTLTGGVTPELLEVMLTTAPPVGEGPFRVTVPVALDPLATEFGDTVNPVKTAGVIVNTVVTEMAPDLAVIVAGVEDPTADVVIVKVAVVLPDATVTLFGGTALELLDVNVTTMPPEGAAPLRLTVPVEEVPPLTEVGDTLTPDNCVAGGVIVRVAVCVVMP